jgi:hypothetical protein
MLSLINKGKRADILQFTLVMLADLLNGIQKMNNIALVTLDVKGFNNELLSLDIFNPLLKYS